MQISAIIFSEFVILVAGFVRGYSGFGYAMVATLSLSLVLSPVEVVPVLFLLSIVSSAWLLPGAWKDIHWRSLSWLSIGALIGTPVGIYLLSSVSSRPMRAGTAIVVIAFVIILWRGFSLKKMPGIPMMVFTGMISGLLNGSAAIGGPPAILFYFSFDSGVELKRASLIAYLTEISIIGLCMGAAKGLVTLKTLFLSGIFLIPFLLGIGIGSLYFKRSDHDSFRSKVLTLLILLSLAALIRALFW
jgi:uncharacterized membrane protein YfcA